MSGFDPLRTSGPDGLLFKLAWERSLLRHYRGRWPEPVVPPGEAEWGYYEVDPELDIVTRTVDLFADGQTQRNSIALEERNGVPCLSLVEGPFMETVRTVPLEAVAPEEFERLYQEAIDTPFWNVS